MRRRFALPRLPSAACTALAALACASAQADGFDAWDGFRLDAREGDRNWVVVSPYTYHFHYSPEHRPVRLLGLERERASGQIAGLSVFSNSFGQPSAYAYPWGRKWTWAEHPGVYLKLTAGVIYGYKPPYEHKVPFNVYGFAPGVIGGIGYQSGPWQVGVDMLGKAAVMFQVSRRL